MLEGLDTEVESVKLIIHSYLSYISDNDQALYFSVIFEVLDDDTSDRFHIIHSYMTYLREFTFETVVGALLESIGKDTGINLLFTKR